MLRSWLFVLLHVLPPDLKPIPSVCCDRGCSLFIFCHLFGAQAPRYAAILAARCFHPLPPVWSPSPRCAAILAACVFPSLATCVGAHPFGVLRSWLLVFSSFATCLELWYALPSQCLLQGSEPLIHSCSRCGLQFLDLAVKHRRHQLCADSTIRLHRKRSLMNAPQHP